MLCYWFWQACGLPILWAMCSIRLCQHWSTTHVRSLSVLVSRCMDMWLTTFCDFGCCVHCSHCWNRGLGFIFVCLGKGFSDRGCFFWGHHTITTPGSVHCQQYPFTRLLLETFRLTLKVFVFLSFVSQIDATSFAHIVTSINPHEAAYVVFSVKHLCRLDAHIRQLPKKQSPYMYTWLSEDEVEFRQIAFVLINAFSSVVTVYEELRATKKFEEMNLNVDEAEHSMEMHLPYLAKVFQGYDTLKGWQSEIYAFLQCHCWKSCRSEGVAFNSVLWRHNLWSGNLCRTSVKIVPILVGSCTPETEAMYGRLLAKYLDDPKNFFSVSSDFCHWGSRYALQSSCSSFSEFQVALTLVSCAYFVLNDGYLRYLVFEVRLDLAMDLHQGNSCDSPNALTYVYSNWTLCTAVTHLGLQLYDSDT